MTFWQTVLAIALGDTVGIPVVIALGLLAAAAWRALRGSDD